MKPMNEIKSNKNHRKSIENKFVEHAEGLNSHDYKIIDNTDCLKKKQGHRTLSEVQKSA